MNGLRRQIRIAPLWASTLVSLALVGCGTVSPSPTPAPEAALLPRTPLGTGVRAAAAAASTQRNVGANDQAVATAQIVRANAQATLNSANATVGAAQTQDQNNANVIAGQIAATAEIIRANAQATLVAAGSTQGAALTQDAIRQTQTSDLATTDAGDLVNQQNRDQLAAGTETAVANNIATQTQIAVATSQWYVDQARQRDEQRQVPIAFLWTWCLPPFILLLAGLALWGFWRWLKIRQTNQRILEGPVGQLQPPPQKVVNLHHDDSLPYLEGDDVDSRYELTKPDDQVHRWLDEVKRKLRSSDQKDEDDHTNS